jgi:flagellar protein FliS
MTVEDYTAKISTATPLGLVIINYELMIHNLHLAKENLEEGEHSDFETHAKKAQAYLMVLMGSLDRTFAISGELLRLYFYVNKLLIQSQFKRDPNLICEACDITGSLLDSWRVLARVESPATKPVMENVEQLVAGLTYKDGRLCEYVLGSENRGIKA